MALDVVSTAKGMPVKAAGIRLKIDTQSSFKNFMRKIHPEFIRVVDPRESGLLDVLYQNDVITESDNSSLSGKDVMTRKDQARKLFILLTSVPLKVFQDKVAPELYAKFPYIIPTEFIDHSCIKSGSGVDLLEEECVRHAIEHRVRPSTVADMLFHKGALDVDQYSVIIIGARKKEKVWETIFDAFNEALYDDNRRDVPATLVAGVKEILKRYCLHVPRDLHDLLSKGLPCTCKASAPLPEKKLNFIAKVLHWLETNKNDLAIPCPEHEQSVEGGTDTTALDRDGEDPETRPTGMIPAARHFTVKFVSQVLRKVFSFWPWRWTQKAEVKLDPQAVEEKTSITPRSSVHGDDDVSDKVSSELDDFVSVVNPSSDGSSSWYSFEDAGLLFPGDFHRDPNLNLHSLDDLMFDELWKRRERMLEETKHDSTTLRRLNWSRSRLSRSSSMTNICDFDEGTGTLYSSTRGSSY